MNELNSTSPTLELEPLPYHRNLISLLRHREPEVWQWFASQQAAADQAERVQLDLLKATYRLERSGYPGLYARAEEVARILGANEAGSVPITLYQSQNDDSLNAFLAYLPGQIHLVFSGPVLRTLDSSELDALLAHEMAHYRLLEGFDKEVQTAERLLVAMAHDGSASTAHRESARLFQLHTEIFADRAALAFTGDLESTVAMLVKMTTGLSEVSAKGYLGQAREIFAREDVHSSETSHPESYVRAHALELWHQHAAGAEEAIDRCLKGPTRLDQLDLLGQEDLSDLTRQLFEHLLAPSWFQTEAVLAHARLFFEDFQLDPEDSPPAALDQDLRRRLTFEDPSMKDYIAFLLLDFVALAEAEDPPLTAAFHIAETLDLGERFGELAHRELRLTRRRVNQIRKKARDLVTNQEQA